MSVPLEAIPLTKRSPMPDAAWIKKKVPVLAVGRALGLPIRGAKTKCWRPDNHTHGDADPSVRFDEPSNRVRCFVCDTRGGNSNIDLVMGVLGFSFRDAVCWIAERFPVPNVKPGRPVGRRSKEPQPFRVGVHGSELEGLVRTGMFGQLSAAESRILVVLAIFRDLDSGVTRMSYQAIMRYSGVASRKSVSGALKQLQRLRALQISRGSRIGITRECNTYRVTFDDPKFVESCNAVCRNAREEIAQERTYRWDLRVQREKESRDSSARRNRPQIIIRSTVRSRSLTEAGGCAPPDPAFIPSKGEKENPFTCKGLNLSSSRESTSNLSVPDENRKTDFDIRLRELQLQAELICRKYPKTQKPADSSPEPKSAQGAI